MGMNPFRKLLDAARAQGRDKAIPPIAVSVTLEEGYDPYDDATLFEPSMLLTPCPHPVLEAFLESSGATRRGRMSWVVGLGEDYNAAPLDILLNRLLPGTLLTENLAANTRGPRDLYDVSTYEKRNHVHWFLQGTVASRRMDDVDRVVTQDYPRLGPGKFGAVTLSGDGRVMWIKVVTHALVVPDHLPQIPLNLRPAGRPFTEPRPVRPVEAMAVLDWLVSEGVTLVDPSENHALAVIRDRISRSVIATPAVGRPALADTSVGRAVFRIPGVTLPGVLPRPTGTEASTATRMSAEDVVALARTLPDGVAVIHPGTADTGAMALANPIDDPLLRHYQCEADGLHLATEIGYVQSCAPGLGKTIIQYAAMRRRAAAKGGYAAALGFEEQVAHLRFAHGGRYRALVVCEANVRTQWVSEGAVWFPEAQIVAVESRSDAAKLAELLETIDGPVVVVISYGLLAALTEEVNRRQAAAEQAQADAAVTASEVEQVSADVVAEAVEDLTAGIAPAEGKNGQLDMFAALVEVAAEKIAREAVESVADAVEQIEVEAEPTPVTLGALLLDNWWDDLAADEAEVLRSTGSKQNAAMWEVRRRAQVAVALTGTPINRGVDDLGRLISWTRNDQHLFHGVRLSKQFDLNDDAELAEFHKAMGPLVFRRDSSEIEDELPTVLPPKILKLTPSPEEKALANAARSELKRVYLELMSWLETVEALDPDNSEYADAKEALKAARGAWLGGTTLARMAASDPAALLGSRSAGAALLAGQGLIEAATARPGTKRTVVVAEVASGVSVGEKVLIFTEFATVAAGLIADLDDAGVRVGAVLGGGGKKRDRMIAEFQRGELDVLVCTASGERGLNLQRATMIVHYDLPWTPKGVIQRTGRALRIKSLNKTLKVVFPIMEGTVEETVVALVVSRGVEAMRALDAARGVDTSKTEMGLALGGLVTAVNDAADKGSSSALMQMTKALVAA